MKDIRVCLLASVSSLALIGASGAADMPTKAPAPIPAPVLSWTGPYIGLNLGAAWNNTEFSELSTPRYAFSSSILNPFWSPDDASFTVGGQIGYNFQAGNFVFGVEGDVNWVNGQTSASFAPPVTFGFVNATSEFDWMATIRGRAGVAFSQVLIYGTGGVAFARFSDAWGYTSFGAREFANDETRTGWVAGGGIEYMFNRNWTVKVEALYADFGSTDVTISALGATYTSRFQHTVTTARAGLNWKW